MSRYIGDNIDAAIELLEILEIKSNGNKTIERLKEKAALELKEMLSSVTNSDWLIMLLLKARESARK